MDAFLINVLLVAFIAGCLDADDVRYEGAQVLRIQPSNSKHFEILDELINRHQRNTDESETLSFWKRSRIFDDKSDLLVPKKHIKDVSDTLSTAGIPVEVLISNVREEIVKEQQQRISRRNTRQEDFYSEYRSYEEIQKKLRFLEKKYPKTLETEVIGMTEEQRKLTIAKVKRSSPIKNRKVAYIESGSHAREWIGPAVSMFILERLLESPSTLEDMDLYILPLLNPDGYEYSRNSDRMWRKNRSVNSETACRGTDLNRNFDFEWMYSDSSPFPCSETYAGSSPGSEDEVKAVKKFLEGLDNLHLFISLHNYGQYWFHPWAYQNNDPPHSEKMTKIGQIAVNKIREEREIHYSYGRSANFLYAASGSSMDWICYELSKKNPDLLSYTIELRDTGKQGFFLHPEHIRPTAEDIWVGLKCVHHQMSTGSYNCDY